MADKILLKTLTDKPFSNWKELSDGAVLARLTQYGNALTTIGELDTPKLTLKTVRSGLAFFNVLTGFSHVIHMVKIGADAANVENLPGSFANAKEITKRVDTALETGTLVSEFVEAAYALTVMDLRPELAEKLSPSQKRAHEQGHAEVLKRLAGAQNKRVAMIESGAGFCPEPITIMGLVKCEIGVFSQPAQKVLRYVMGLHLN